MLALAALAVGVLLGLFGVYVGGVHLQEVVGIVLLMGAAYIGGPAAAVMGGLLAGFFFALTGGK